MPARHFEIRQCTPMGARSRAARDVRRLRPRRTPVCHDGKLLGDRGSRCHSLDTGRRNDICRVARDDRFVDRRRDGSLLAHGRHAGAQ